MTYALLGALVIVCVLFAVLSFRAHSTSIRALEESHERSTKYTEDLLDRLMSMDYNTYKAYQQMEEVRDEASEAVPPEPLVPTLGPDRGGYGSRLGLRALSVRASYEDTEELLESEIPG